jgi:hypothetical protein
VDRRLWRLESFWCCRSRDLETTQAMPAWRSFRRKGCSWDLPVPPVPPLLPSSLLYFLPFPFEKKAASSRIVSSIIDQVNLLGRHRLSATDTYSLTLPFIYPWAAGMGIPASLDVTELIGVGSPMLPALQASGEITDRVTRGCYLLHRDGDVLSGLRREWMSL